RVFQAIEIRLHFRGYWYAIRPLHGDQESILCNGPRPGVWNDWSNDVPGITRPWMGLRGELKQLHVASVHKLVDLIKGLEDGSSIQADPVLNCQGSECRLACGCLALGSKDNHFYQL